MSTNPQEYNLSGKLGNGPLIPLGAFVYVVITGTTYGFLTALNPFIYVNICATLLYGMRLGHVFRAFSEFSNCRNTQVTLIVSFLGSLLCLFSAWIGFIAFQTKIEFSILELFFNPLKIADFIKFASENGLYSIMNYTPKGIALWLIWIAEMLIIVLGAIYFADTSHRKLVYCENCECWCTDEKIQPLQFGYPTEDNSLIDQLASGHLTKLESFPKKQKGPMNSHLEINIHTCPKCHSFGTYKLSDISYNKDDNGKTKKNKADLSGFMTLGQSDIQYIESLIPQVTATPKK